MGDRKTKRGLNLLVGALVSATFAGANLQTLVLGATPITEDLTELVGETEYFIENERAFLKFRDLVNAGEVAEEAKIALTANLDLTEGGSYENCYCDSLERKAGGSVEWISSNCYTPVGIEGVGDADNDLGEFRAKFDGQGHEITVTVHVDKMRHVGIFGYVGKGGEVKNLGISGDSYISVSGWLAGIVGGIVGFTGVGGTISGCYNDGFVEDAGIAGGIAGYVNGKMIGCHNTGAICGYGDTGGIAGDAGQAVSEISGCYNTGRIRSNNHAGGIVGRAIGENIIVGCYNAGIVASSRGNVGSIVGFKNILAGSPTGVVDGCYYLNSTAAGVVGNSVGATVNVGPQFDDEMKTERFVELLNLALKNANQMVKFEWVEGEYPRAIVLEQGAEAEAAEQSRGRGYATGRGRGCGYGISRGRGSGYGISRGRGSGYGISRAEEAVAMEQGAEAEAVEQGAEAEAVEQGAEAEAAEQGAEAEAVEQGAEAEAAEQSRGRGSGYATGRGRGCATGRGRGCAISRGRGSGYGISRGRGSGYGISRGRGCASYMARRRG